MKKPSTLLTIATALIAASIVFETPAAEARGGGGAHAAGRVAGAAPVHTSAPRPLGHGYRHWGWGRRGWGRGWGGGSAYGYENQNYYQPGPNAHDVDPKYTRADFVKNYQWSTPVSLQQVASRKKPRVL